MTLLRKIRELYVRARKTYGIVWTVKGLLKACFWTALPDNCRADVLLICHDVHRHGQLDGRAYSPLIDGIRDALSADVKTLSIVAPFSERDGNATYGHSLNFNSYLLMGYLRRLMASGTSEVRQLSSDPVVAGYLRILNLVRPSVVIGIQPSVEFCHAAKIFGAQIFDVQHGIISSVNYYSPEKRKSVGQMGWPDAVLCWDEQSAERVGVISKDHTTSFVIGNPAYHSPVARRYKSKNLFAPSSSLHAEELRILVTLTYQDWNEDSALEGVATDPMFSSIGITTPVVNLMNATESVMWCVRMHPIQYRTARKKTEKRLSTLFHGKKNIEWEKSSRAPLRDILTECHGHLTVHSAVAIDAFQNNLKTVLVACDGWSDESTVRDYFDFYISNGYMRFEGGDSLPSEELCAFWSSGLNQKNQQPAELYAERFDAFFSEMEGGI